MEDFLQNMPFIKFPFFTREKNKILAKKYFYIILRKRQQNTFYRVLNVF